MWATGVRQAPRVSGPGSSQARFGQSVCQAPRASWPQSQRAFWPHTSLGFWSPVQGGGGGGQKQPSSEGRGQERARFHPRIEVCTFLAALSLAQTAPSPVSSSGLPCLPALPALRRTTNLQCPHLQGVPEPLKGGPSSSRGTSTFLNKNRRNTPPGRSLERTAGAPGSARTFGLPRKPGRPPSLAGRL